MSLTVTELAIEVPESNRVLTEAVEHRSDMRDTQLTRMGDSIARIEKALVKVKGT